ncbi:MAG: hypothetical protein ABI867_11525 [Kofleriaceae bacterium]
MMKTTLLLLALAGCFPTRSAELACDVTTDCEAGRTCQTGFCVAAEVDAGIEDDADTSDADSFDCTKLQGRQFAGCDLPRPDPALELGIAGTYTYNTDTGTLVDPSGTTATPANKDLPPGKVISVESFTLAAGATLRVTGAKPLIIAAFSTISIAGVIDAGSTPTELGAGANPGDCSAHASLAGQSTNDGAGGGGGGSRGGAGGRGGQGGGGQGGTGGVALTAAPLLLGGCPGAAGGVGDAANNNGAGGGGGGAIQLTAAESITITGTITTGGAGGGPAASSDGGGGGGGSGGMIGLESATVTIDPTAILAANGGGGGGGSGSNAALPGANGLASAVRANGGQGNNGGNGGLGSAATIINGNTGNNDGDGGGGGGGAAGFVVLSSTAPAQLQGATVSPAATLVAR